MEEKRPNQCVVDGCELDRYDGHDKCILHCEKSLFSKDNTPLFYETLVLYLENIFSDRRNYSKAIHIYFSIDELTPIIKDLGDYFKNSIVFTDIYFPLGIDSTFFQRLEGLGDIKFLRCEFQFDKIPDFNNSYIFEECKFHEKIGHKFNGNRYVSFDNCIFNSYYFVGNGSNNLSLPTFNTCSFSIEFELYQVYINDYNLDSCSFVYFDIISSSITSDFIIPICYHFTVKNTIFLSNVFSYRYKNVQGLSIEFKNVTISGTLDLSQIVIQNLSLYDTKIGSVYAGHAKFFVIKELTNVSIMKSANFSFAHFCRGLDLNSVFLLGSANFINIQIDENAANPTPKDTLRLIKHSFDSIGNTIEANKYFALEMNKLYSELAWKKNFSEKLLLSINKYTSNFGQNWWLPILWIFGFASLFYSLRKYDPFDYPFLNGIASFIIPYQGIIGTSHQMSKLLTSILFGVLIYQTTVALKRKTRR
jgi:hypothetical protein